MLALSAFSQEPSARQRSTSPDLKAFFGTWQLDASRSKSGSVALSYEQAGDKIQATTPRGSYTFKIDGNEYPAAVKGEMIIWRQVDKNTIETTSKQNGNVQAITTRKFSPDGKTAALTLKLMRDRPPATITGRMERQSEANDNNPLLGTWTQRYESTTNQTRALTYTPIANGLHVRYEGGRGEEYDLVFDEQQHPVPSAGGDLTARVIDERTIEERWTRDGQATRITITPDGQELTERQGPPRRPQRTINHGLATSQIRCHCSEGRKAVVEVASKGLRHGRLGARGSCRRPCA